MKPREETKTGRANCCWPPFETRQKRKEKGGKALHDRNPKVLPFSFTSCLSFLPSSLPAVKWLHFVSLQSLGSGPRGVFSSLLLSPLPCCLFTHNSIPPFVFSFSLSRFFFRVGDTSPGTPNNNNKKKITSTQQPLQRHSTKSARGGVGGKKPRGRLHF